MHCIQRWALTRFDVALDRVIGDSQVSTTHLWIGVLELEDGDGHVGTGFFHTVTEPLPSLSELRTRFAARARRPGHRCEPFRVGQSTGTPSPWTDEDIGLLPQRRAGDVGPAGPDPRPAALQAARGQSGTSAGLREWSRVPSHRRAGRRLLRRREGGWLLDVQGQGRAPRSGPRHPASPARPGSRRRRVPADGRCQ